MTIEHRELEVAHYNARPSSAQGSGFSDALLVESRMSAESASPATCPSFFLFSMMDSIHARSISRRAQLVGISRGSVYDVPTSISATDLALMRRMDVLHLEHSFMGVRMLRDRLNRMCYKRRSLIMANWGW
jgi:hypothetical protein